MCYYAGFADKRITRRRNADSYQMISWNAYTNYGLVTIERTYPSTIAVTTAEVEDEKASIANVIPVDRQKKREPL